MDELQQMDELERQLRSVRDPDDLEKIDPQQVEQLLGEEAARDLERLREMTKKLEEAGYLERKGDRLELTARAIRKIGDKALRDIFAHLKRDRFGGTRSSAGARAATAPTRPSATSSATRSCSTCARR